MKSGKKHSFAQKIRNIKSVAVIDFRHIASNSVALIVAAGLVIVPPLYAWFNIAGSYDPYGNVSNLKIAVADCDEGYKSELLPVRVNAGDKLVSQISKAGSFDWKFTDENKALEGVKSGEYYAAIVIPKSFTEDIMTLFSPQFKHAKLEYYVNEKINAVSPQITKKGASSAMSKINVLFAKTVSQICIDAADDLISFSKSDRMREYLQQAVSHLENMADDTCSASEQISAFASIADTSAKLVSQAQSLARGTSQTFENAKNGVRDASSSFESVRDALASSLESVENALQAVKSALSDAGEKADSLTSSVSGELERVEGKVADLSKITDSAFSDLTEKIEELRKIVADSSFVPENIRTEILSACEKILSQLNSAREKMGETASLIAQTAADSAAKITERKIALKTAIFELNGSIQSVRDVFSSSLRQNAQTLFASISQIAENVRETGDMLSLSESKLSEAAEASGEKIEGIKTTLNDSAAGLSELSQKMRDFKTRLTTAYSSALPADLTNILSADPDTLAAFLSSPAALRREVVYPVENYGSAMAPFYTILAIWVGSVVLVAMMKTGVSRKIKEKIPGISSDEEYFGRYAIFLFLSLFQALLVAFGDLIFLRVQAVNVFQFFFACIAASLVFSNIMYTLTVSFGDVGKAVSVVLLVMQVAGSGGTFPIETLPEFFRKCCPFLPFPHGIDALHAAVCGSYGSEFAFQIGLLALFLIPSLLLGLILRKPLIGFNAFISEKIESAKVM